MGKMTLVYTTVLLMLMVTALTALPQSSDNLASPITQEIHMKIVFRGVEDGFANGGSGARRSNKGATRAQQGRPLTTEDAEWRMEDRFALPLLLSALTTLPHTQDNLASRMTQEIHMKIVFRGVEDGFANNEGLLMTMSVVSNSKKMT